MSESVKMNATVKQKIKQAFPYVDYGLSYLNSNVLFFDALYTMNSSDVFRKRNLSNVNFDYEDLIGRNLSDSIMHGVDLQNRDIHNADLSSSDLSEANLSGAILFYVKLRGAYMRGTNLSNAKLWDAELYGADLQGADIRGADLFYADLRSADLTNANLSGVNLRHTNFDGAILTCTDFIGANYDSHTLDTLIGDAKISLRKHGRLW